METQIAFNDLMKQANVLLKKYGFKKQSLSFYKKYNENWGIISFQKSIKNTATKIFFTINLGICSHEIRKFFDPDKTHKRPTISDCHWWQRIGEVIEPKDDIWWVIDERTDLIQLYKEIENKLINHAVNVVNNLISDEALENLWQSKLPDQLDFRSKLNLAILLKKFRKIDELNIILTQLEKETEGKPTAVFLKVAKIDLIDKN